jgi:hypothetical protein
MRKGRRHLGGWGSWIDRAQVSLRNKTKEHKADKSKRMKNKQD